MKISRHGSKRIKERVGLPKRAHLRHIQSVLKLGNKVTETTKDGFKMIHNGFLYIFANLENNEPILVTTYEEPNKNYIKLANFKN
ncbi:MAG: hypothetical protein DRG78_01835 [Epsilonproteobacteria bacterium]|nr:MAG: hypothetical protein DRG78_01835 [Campylobacterota bacterium]